MPGNCCFGTAGGLAWHEQWPHERRLVTTVIYSILVFLRDVALLAAATGIAWWTWDRRAGALHRQNEEASVRMAAERAAADARQSAARLETLAGQISAALDELAASARASEARANAKADIHRLLHATSEPFLTFAEIRSGLPDHLDDLAVRRMLIDLTADGVVAQLEGDRYFIASDYDADETEAA